MLLFCLRDGFANIACYSGLTAFICFRCVLASAAWAARPRPRRALGGRPCTPRPGRRRAAPWAARGASASALGAMEAFLSLGNVAVADFVLGQDSSNSCLCFSLPQHSVDAFRR